MMARIARLMRLKGVRHACGNERGGVHLGVDLALYPAAFAWRTARVEDDLGVDAGEEDEADGPIGVAEDGAAEEDHLQIDGGLLSVAGDGSVELVHVGVGTVALHLERVEGAGAVLGGAQVGKGGGRIAGLEVGLAVEVLGLDKGDVVVLGGRTDEDVGGDGLVVEDLDKVADADVLPEGLGPVRGAVGVCGVELDGGLGERGLGAGAGRDAAGDDAPDKGASLGAGRVWVGPGGAGEDADGGVVHAAVGLVALDVFVGILDGGDAEDDDDGEKDEAGGDGGELWEELEDGDEEEEARGGEHGGAGEKGRRTCWRCGGTARGGCGGGR